MVQKNPNIVDYLHESKSWYLKYAEIQFGKLLLRMSRKILSKIFQLQIGLTFFTIDFYQVNN